MIFEIAGRQLDAPNEIVHPLRLGHVAGEWLLARDAFERTAPRLYCLYDLRHVFNAGVVRSAEPDRVDGRVRDHVGDARVRLRVADVERARELGRRSGVLPVRAPNAAHLGVTNGLERLDVKARVEAAADEADTERGGGHERLSGGRTGVRGGLEDARMPPF